MFWFQLLQQMFCAEMCSLSVCVELSNPEKLLCKTQIPSAMLEWQNIYQANFNTQ